MGGNLPVILGTDQSLMPATDWHDGQITWVRWRRVKALLSFRVAAIAASYDVQLHIGESIYPSTTAAQWIPGLRLSAHPGMTRPF